jgi:O-antigen/teichoic acid export membrane protein
LSIVDSETQSSQEELHADIGDLTRGSLVTLVGKLGRLSRGAFLWVISFAFGTDVQGLYSVLWGIVSTVNRVGHFGLERGVVRYLTIARRSNHGDEASVAIGAAMRIGLPASIATSIVLFFTADYLEAFFDQPIGTAILIVSFTAPFTALTGIFVAATRALRIMRYDVYVTSIVGPIILLGGGLIAVLMDAGLHGIMYAQFAMTVGACALSIIYFRRFFELGASIKHIRGESPWRPMARFSSPVMLADVLSGVLTQLDGFMLLKMTTPHDAGIYVLARRLASTMLKPLQAVDPIFSSIISDLSDSNKHAELQHRFTVVSRWVLTINVPILAILLLIGYELLPLLDKKDRLSGLADFEMGFTILAILCVGMLIQGVYGIAEPFIAMCGRPKLNLYNNIVWLIANFGLNLWLIEAYGIIGAAVGATASVVIVNMIRVVQLYWIQKFKPFDRTQLKPILAAASGGLLTWLVASQLPSGVVWAVATLLLFLASYLLVLRTLGLEEEDKMALARIRERLRRSPPE